MTRPIGERFMHDGVLLEVVEELLSPGLPPIRRYYVTGECIRYGRSDNRDVIFKRIKEGGEG